MEEMNTEIMQMIDELHMMQRSKEANGLNDAETDKYGFPFEPFDAFSAEPLGFVEKTMRLNTESAILFSQVSRISRFSPLFIRMSAQLERMTARLGSCCITKAVLEQQEGKSIRALRILTIGSLREMAAFNFRKCYASFMESDAAGVYKPEAFTLSMRWAALDSRLEATEEKIEMIKAGKIKAAPAGTERPAASENSASGKQNSSSASFAAKENALPIDRGALREAEQRNIPDTPETAAAEQPAAVPTSSNPAEAAADTEAAVPVSGEITEPYGPAPEENTGAEYSDEEFMRDVLMADAAGRGDRDAWEAAENARGPGLESLWEQYLERESRTGYSQLKQLGMITEDGRPPGGHPEFTEEYALETA